LVDPVIKAFAVPTIHRRDASADSPTSSELEIVVAARHQHQDAPRVAETTARNDASA